MATGNNRDKITSTVDEEGIPYDDPRFVEILEACLHVEIAAYKESYGKTQAEIKKIKRNVLTKLEKRKELKKKIEDAEDLISMSNVTLKRLREDVRETKQRIESIETNADDRSKLMSYEMQRYREILGEYEKTWQSYHAEYETFPLAKKRKETEIELKKVRVEKMVLEFKLVELEKKCERKKRIDDIRMRLKIIELAKAMANSETLERKLIGLRNEIDHCKLQLHSRELELKSLQRQEEMDRKERAMKLLEMPPPKINLSRVRLNYSREWQQELELRKRFPPIDSDSMSVNTIALEEMCISDDATDKEPAVSVSTKDPQRSTTTLLSDYETKEKERRDAKSTESLAIGTSLPRTRSKKSLSFSRNAESIAKRRSFEGKDERKGSTMATSLEEERPIDREDNRFVSDSRESKRTKFVRKEDSKDDENVDVELSQASKRSVRYPRIAKIEKVRYGVSPLTKRAMRNVLDASKSFVSNSFDYETNASRATSFALNDAIKDLNDSISGHPSIYDDDDDDDDSRHFRLSECANVSNIVDTDINMESVDENRKKVEGKEDGIETSSRVTPRFNFSDLLKLKTDNNFRIF